MRGSLLLMKLKILIFTTMYCCQTSSFICCVNLATKNAKELWKHMFHVVTDKMNAK